MTRPRPRPCRRCRRRTIDLVDKLCPACRAWNAGAEAVEAESLGDYVFVPYRAPLVPVWKLLLVAVFGTAAAALALVGFGMLVDRPSAAPVLQWLAAAGAVVSVLAVVGIVCAWVYKETFRLHE